MDLQMALQVDINKTGYKKKITNSNWTVQTGTFKKDETAPNSMQI